MAYLAPPRNDNLFRERRLSYSMLALGFSGIPNVTVTKGNLEALETPRGEPFPNDVYIDPNGILRGYMLERDGRFIVAFQLSPKGERPTSIELDQKDGDRNRTVRSALSALLRIYAANQPDEPIRPFRPTSS